MRVAPENQGVLIIGGGAQGTLLAHAVTSAGGNPRVVGRNHSQPFHKRLKIDGQGIELHLPAATPAEIAAPAVIFLAVKAHQLEHAIAEHLPNVQAACPVIVTANGFLEELLSAHSLKYPRFIWRLGLSTCGVSQTDGDSYTLAGKGKIIWGPFSGRATLTEAEKKLLDARGDIFSWEPFPRPFCRRKWLFNVVANSLAAVHRLAKNEDLLNLKEELAETFDEAFALGETLFGSWPWTSEELFSAMKSLIEATAQNENSMACDVRLGRKTETDFLAGLAARYPGFPKLKSLHAILRQS